MVAAAASALVLLAVVELLAGLSPATTSSLAAVGDSLGVEPSVTLAAGGILGSILWGAAVGALGRDRLVAAAIGFTTLGIAAAAVASTGAKASPFAWLNASIATIAALAAFRFLLARSPGDIGNLPDELPQELERELRTSASRDRRSFLVLAGATALISAGAAAFGLLLTRRRDRRPSPTPEQGDPPPTSRPKGDPDVRVAPRTRLVPPSIDATGGTDVGAELSAWLTSVAAEADVIRFPAGATYRINDGPVNLDDASDLVVDFDGARLRRDRLLDRPLRYPNNTPYLSLQSPRGVVIRNLRTDGVNTNTEAMEAHADGVFPPGHKRAGDPYLLDANGEPHWMDNDRSDLLEPDGWGTWVVALAFEHSIRLLDAVDAVVEDCDVRGAGGDGVYIGGHGTRGVVVRRVLQRRNGRQGIAIVEGHDILIEHCDLKSRRGAIDIEPDRPADPFVISNVEIRHCTIRAGLLAFPNQGAGAIDGVNIHHNDIYRAGTPLLQTTGSADSPRTNYRFEDNVDHEGRKGVHASFRLKDTHDMVIARNVVPRQPHPEERNRRAVQFEEVACTGIEVRDNIFPNTATIVDDEVGGSTFDVAGNATP